MGVTTSKKNNTVVQNEELSEKDAQKAVRDRRISAKVSAITKLRRHTAPPEEDTRQKRRDSVLSFIMKSRRDLQENWESFEREREKPDLERRFTLHPEAPKRVALRPPSPECDIPGASNEVRE